jgi:hypothetical protein
MKVVLKEDLIPELIQAQKRIWSRVVGSGKRHPLWAEGRVGNYLHNIRDEEVFSDLMEALTSLEVPVRVDHRKDKWMKEHHEPIAYLWVSKEDVEEAGIMELFSPIKYLSGQLYFFEEGNLGYIPFRFIRNGIGVSEV